MKRIHFIYALIALVLLPVSCSRTTSDTEVPDPVSVEEQGIRELQSVQGKTIAPLTLRAGFSEESRSYLEMNGQDTEAAVFWAAGDSFRMMGYSPTEDILYIANYTTAEGGAIADFTTTHWVPSPCYSVYPAIEKQGMLPDGTLIFGVNLPSVQTAVEGNIAPGLNLSYAYSESQYAPLYFKNLVSLVRFRLSGSIVSKITSVTLSGISPLAGDLVLVADAAGGYLDTDRKFEGDEKSSSVSLIGTFSAGKDYYIAAAPAASQLLTLTFANADGDKKTKFAFNEVTLARGSIFDFGTIGLGDSFDESVPAVDLGLPSGLKWAACNLGASRPEEYGDYYAWGETEPKEKYSWETYKFGTDFVLSKYVTDPAYGAVDHKTLLDPEDDAAVVNLGGSWRMPTEAEYDELISKAIWTWTSRNGVSGYLVTGLNGNSIFLPAAGHWEHTTSYYSGSEGFYWTSSCNTQDYPGGSRYMGFDSDEVGIGGFDRFCGFSIRPVLSNPASVSWVKLDQTALSLYEGASAILTAMVLPETAANKQVTWSSSNSEVASVDANGTVQALKAGEATITATTADGGRTAGCTVTVTYHPQTPELVDLGLSVKWATFNLGATKPEEYGDYFAWGETAPKADYSWSTYKWCNGSYNSLIKYCNNSSYGDNGFTDNKTVLDPEDDAAAAALGGSWRMATDAEWDELKTDCTWEWTTLNDVYGRKVTSNKEGYTDKWIFLPAAGYRYGTSLYNAGSNGLYWSSSLYTDYPGGAYHVGFGSDGVNWGSNDRGDGFSVRPVQKAIRVTGVSLNKTSMQILTGDSDALTATVAPSDAENQSVVWTSSDENIATVYEDGVVGGVGVGTAEITATTVDGGFTAKCTVTVTAYPVPEMVDLGLSVKWASFNLGATKPEEYGDYFAWGETEPKEDYSWSTYKFELGTDYNGPFSKYVTQSSYGTVDNKTVLDPEDDAATVALGGSWRMATYAEWHELRTDCTWEWTTLNDVYGRKVTSNKEGYTDKWIFLPAAGYRNGASLYSAGSLGLYWSSSLYTGYPRGPYGVNFDSGSVGWGFNDRYYGQSVRPVSE